MEDKNEKDEPRVQAEDNSIAIGRFNIDGDLSGELNIVTGDIIKNINTFHERALTAAEEADQARKRESILLAQGVGQFVQNLANLARHGTDIDSPYKGLLAYSLNEAKIFYGRNKAKKDLINRIKQSPLTVLHAESGAGKSSLLQAGIAAQLISEGHLAIRLRPHNADPVDCIKEMFLPELTQAPVLAAASLREFLRQACAVLGPQVNLYLLIDQFEEFFHLLTRDERQPFLKSLADCLNDPTLKVRWVLALRKEALSDLAELESFGITQFNNTYRLNRLRRAEAQEAIIGPAGRYDILFEKALIDHILDTLSTNDEIRPTHLQLVCSALTDDLPEDKTLTLSYYTEHEGGTEGILRDYLKRQVEDLPAEEQALAWKVLRALITADHQRAVKTHDEIIEELKTNEVGKQQINAILGRLIERRLLFTQPATIEKFELAHEYLVREINLDPQEQARKAAQELLDQEVRAYQRHGTLLAAERLAVIKPYQSELRLSEEAKELVDRSQQAIQSERRYRERRRRWIVSGTLIALLTIIALLSGWLITNRQQNFKIKEQQVYAQSLLSQDSNLDINLLQWAERIEELPEARFGLSSYVQNNYSPIKHRVWPDPPGWIFTMDISPDRSVLATGRPNGLINLWNANTLQALSSLQGPKGLVHYVKFSPTGNLLAASFDDPDASVYLWNMSDGQLLSTIPTGARWAKSITFNPDETIMAISLDSRDDIEIWDITKLEHPALLQTLSKLGGRAASIALSPQGNLLAAGLIGPSENTILLWDTTNWEIVCQFSESKDWIYSVDFDMSGTLLASGGRDVRVGLWDPVACESKGFLDGHTDAIQSVNFSQDGTLLVSSSFDNTVRAWNLEEQKEIGLPLTGHNFIVNDAVFGKDNNTLYSGSLDGSIILWDRNLRYSFGKEILSAGGYIDDISLDAEGKILVALSQDKIRIWNTSDFQPIDVPALADKNVRKYALSNDGQFLATLDGAKKIQILRIVSGSVSADFDLDSELTVNSMAFHPANQQLALAGSHNKFISYDLQDHTVREKIEADESIDIRIVTFNPDGNYLVTGNTRGGITLWNAKTLEPIKSQFGVHQDWVTDLAFSPDGKVLASTSYDGTILLWDAKTLQPIGSPLVGHKSHVFTLAFSPNQPLLISGGADKAIIWWSLDNHMIIGKLNSEDSSSVTHVAVDKNDQFIVSSSGAGNIFVWRMDDEFLRNIACQITERNLTQAEWNQYFPDQRYHATCDKYPPGK